jgi:hypothetical protein
MCNWIHVPMNEKSPNSNKPTIQKLLDSYKRRPISEVALKPRLTYSTHPRVQKAFCRSTTTGISCYFVDRFSPTDEALTLELKLGHYRKDRFICSWLLRDSSRSLALINEGPICF